MLLSRCASLCAETDPHNISYVALISLTGLLAKPVNVDNYKDETPVNLFGHNVMQKETKANDILNEYSGTGELAGLRHRKKVSSIQF